MAMKRCKECGNDVAKSAEKCPNCGATLKKKRKPTSCLAMLVGIFVVAVLVSQGRKSDRSPGSGQQAGQPAEVQGFTWGESIEGVTQRLGLPAVAGADGKLNIKPIVLNKMTFQRELVYVEGKVVGLQLMNLRPALFHVSLVPLRDALTKKYGKPVDTEDDGSGAVWYFEKGGSSVRMEVIAIGARWAGPINIVYMSSAHLAKVKQAEEAKREETLRELEGDL